MLIAQQSALRYFFGPARFAICSRSARRENRIRGLPAQWHGFKRSPTHLFPDLYVETTCELGRNTRSKFVFRHPSKCSLRSRRDVER